MSLIGLNQMSPDPKWLDESYFAFDNIIVNESSVPTPEPATMFLRRSRIGPIPHPYGILLEVINRGQGFEDLRVKQK